jgi:hydrogenase nickel incorporation protein HypA/HybF
MHELSATRHIFEIVMAQAHLSEADSVDRINLVIGDFSNIVPDCVNVYWKELTKGSICENAEIHFDRRAVVFSCQQCQNTFELQGKLSICPNCGSDQISFLSGDEMLVESIEITKFEENS